MTGGRRILNSDNIYAEFSSAESLAREYFLVSMASAATVISFIVFLLRDMIFLTKDYAENIVNNAATSFCLICSVVALIVSVVYLRRRVEYQKQWRKGIFVIKIRKCVKREYYVSTRNYQKKYYLTFDNDVKVRVFKELYQSTEEGDFFYMVHIASFFKIFSCNEWILDERLGDMLIGDTTEN